MIDVFLSAFRVEKAVENQEAAGVRWLPEGHSLDAVEPFEHRGVGHQYLLLLPGERTKGGIQDSLSAMRLRFSRDFSRVLEPVS
jgi:hypothetical protein